MRELVPDSQSYMDLLAFERKLDATIMRKRLDIQETLKRPVKIKKKLRVFITNQFYPVKTSNDNSADNTNAGQSSDDNGVPQWELKIEGRIHEEVIYAAQCYPLIINCIYIYIFMWLEQERVSGGSSSLECTPQVKASQVFLFF